MVHLEPVTNENLEEVLSLRLNESQAGYVSTTAESLAQAYVYQETAFPFAVYSDREIVGFIMMGYYEAKKYYTLWKLLIDRNYQHRVRYLKDRFHVTEIYTGVIPGNSVAKGLYESLGFRETGVFENNMIELRLNC